MNESTIDNDATSTEIQYLSRLYLATHIKKYKDSALDGIRYILKAQYPNGGWPQFWPRPKGYYTHITYNEMANQPSGVHNMTNTPLLPLKHAPMSYPH